MAAVQLSFSLRTSSSCKTVHLIGNWDGYKGQLPLSKDSSKSGSWKGTFRFQGATLQQGQRYWYYYMIDGYHVSHDPAKPFTTEPTTGRQLNVLDVPVGAAATTSSSSSSRHSRRASKDIPRGRPVSPSRLQHPRPTKPHATLQVRTADFAGHATVESMTARFASASVEDNSDFEEDSDSDSDDSDVPSLGSSVCSSRPGSATSMSSSCSCERYGITRAGDRVRLDCGGSRCGASDIDSCSEFEDSDNEECSSPTRRNGIVVRHSRR